MNTGGRKGGRGRKGEICVLPLLSYPPDPPDLPSLL